MFNIALIEKSVSTMIYFKKCKLKILEDFRINSLILAYSTNLNIIDHLCVDIKPECVCTIHQDDLTTVSKKDRKTSSWLPKSFEHYEICHGEILATTF